MKAFVLRSVWLLLVTTDTISSVSAHELAFEYSGSVRLRYETLNNPIFPTTEEARSKTNERLSTRIRFKSEITYGHWQVVGELEDARAYLDDNDPTLKSSQVNVLEPIQFYLSYKSALSYIDGVTLGRVTLDHGSRRLMGRTRFRNATNTFEGMLVDTSWHKWSARAFYLFPVTRFPEDSKSIDDNKRGFDKSYSNRKIYGIYAESKDNAWKIHSYWLKESDSVELSTKNRDLYTLSIDHTAMLLKDWQFNIEAIGQVGEARETALSFDEIDKNVRAWMVHSHIGKQISNSTMLRAEIDAASGDNDNTDGTIHAFDSLYGLRRFDFGPTDVYQTFPRSNILAPGLRSVTKLGGLHNIMIGYKALWLHKVASGAEDFLGHQLEFRWRFQVAKPLRVEFGGAYLAKGDALENGAYPDNAMYGYSGLIYTF